MVEAKVVAAAAVAAAVVAEAAVGINADVEVHLEQMGVDREVAVAKAEAMEAEVHLQALMGTRRGLMWRLGRMVTPCS